MIFITYNKTDWSEQSMTLQNKLDALDNLEGMYSSAVSYINNILHEADYYTESVCDEKFFSASTDGEGSGLVCETLNGYTALQIITAGAPSGVIGIWPGSIETIPDGWVLCDGENDTPDLRDCFIPGAGNHYSYSSTGGSNTVVTEATITIANHTLLAEEIPKHTHGTIVDYYPSGPNHAADGWANNSSDDDSLENHNRNTDYTGGGGSHNHTATWTGDEQTRMPPFRAACFIMKT